MRDAGDHGNGLDVGAQWMKLQRGRRARRRRSSAHSYVRAVIWTLQRGRRARRRRSPACTPIRAATVSLQRGRRARRRRSWPTSGIGVGRDGFNEAGVRDAGDPARAAPHADRLRGASTRPACETPEIVRVDHDDLRARLASTRPACETPEIRVVRHGSPRRARASTRPACETPEIPR